MISDLTASQLVGCLRGVSLKKRTGILVVPLPWLGRECEIATRLGISYEDERELVLNRLPPGQRFLGQSWKDVIAQDLDKLVCNSRLDGDCVLVANVDIIISSFLETDRNLFWKFLFDSYKPSKGVLLALPDNTQRLLTDTERWTRAGRLANWLEGAV